MTGGYRPKFESIGDRAKGGFFTRAPWKSKPKIQVEVTKAGNVIIASRDLKIEQLGEPMEEISDLLTGPYLHKYLFYRVYLERGKRFTFSGEATFLVAGKISN